MVSLLILGIVSFAAWFVSMLAGGGSPLVLIPLVSILFGAQAVAPVITTGMFVGNAQRTIYFWRDIDWQLTFWQIPGAIAGSIFGVYVFTQIDLEWMQLFVGVALLLMVGNYFFNSQNKSSTLQLQPWHFLPISWINSFASALVGSTGPILNPIYLSYGLEKEPMIATKSVNVAFMHLIKLGSYLVLGVLDWQYVAYGLVIGMAAIPANWLGRIVLSRMSSEQFRQIVFTFIAISGIFMVWEQRGVLLLAW